MRQCAVGIALARILRRERGLGALLVGICPVEYLLLDELAGGERLEGGAGQIEVTIDRNRGSSAFACSTNF